MKDIVSVESLLICTAAGGSPPEGAGVGERSANLVAAEEPLVILVGETPLVTLMRTPGADMELALGYLITEGLIRSAADVGAVCFCEDAEIGMHNAVKVIPTDGSPLAGQVPAHRRVFSSCGVCGADAIDDVLQEVAALSPPVGGFDAEGILSLGRKMRTRQEGFAATGGTHAAALANMPIDANSVADAVICEDIGRHNALDKAVGVAVRADRDLRGSFLFLSGRVSYEMIAKAARAGISCLAGVSAPTSLAVGLAKRLGMFLAGFAREDSLKVYSGFDLLARRSESEADHGSDPHN